MHVEVLSMCNISMVELLYLSMCWVDESSLSIRLNVEMNFPSYVFREMNCIKSFLPVCLLYFLFISPPLTICQFCLVLRWSEHQVNTPSGSVVEKKKWKVELRPNCGGNVLKRKQRLTNHNLTAVHYILIFILTLNTEGRMDGAINCRVFSWSTARV